MSTAKPRTLLRIEYEKAAEAYLRSLPLEHFMEATAQATQREITLASFRLIKYQRSDFKYFNELLVQYPRKGATRLGQVVPDNMVVVCDEPIDATTSYDLPFQPVKPFCALEYVSKHSERKDYEENFEKYERELKIPYYLLFHPDHQELTLYRHTGRKYVSVKPNEQGRLEITEIELEVGLLDGWVRYWYRGELLPLPEDLQKSLDEVRRQLESEQKRADKAEQRADQAEQRAESLERELAELRARLNE